MTNAGNKKLLVVLLALALLSLSVMALGGTFASQVNKNDPEQKLGNDQDFKVSVAYCTDGTNYSPNFLKTPVFTQDVSWCPGYTKVVYLQVKNDEKFPVECILTLEANDVNEGNLSDVMSYAVIDITQSSDALPNSWENFKEQAKETTGGLSSTNDITVFHIPADQPLDSEGKKHYALAIHMDESATNIHAGQSMDIKFNLTVNANYRPGITPPFPTLNQDNP